MKSYNILKTIFILLIKEKTTVAYLAEELEVSQRTVKRYLDDILCLNMPIYTQPGRNGGVYFDKMEISKEVIAKVYEDFEIEEIEERGDKLIVTSTRADNPSLMPLIMSYGGYAKVLAPTEITQKVIEQIELIKKIYKR